MDCGNESSLSNSDMHLLTLLLNLKEKISNRYKDFSLSPNLRAEIEKNVM